MNELSRHAWERAIWSLCRRFRGVQGALYKGRPAGELSTDSRGSAPPEAPERGGGQALPASPSESPRHFAAPGLKVS